MGYSVFGNKIFQNGQEVQLFGVNIIGLELNDATIGGLWAGLSIPQYVSDIKAQSFNCVRLPIGKRALQNVKVDEGLTAASWLPANASLKGKGSLDILDIWIDEFEKQGIRYIFDVHHLENGKIPDLWYSANLSETEWLEMISKLALRYKGRQGFVGIDIKNEPNLNSCTWGDGNTKTDWKLASEKAHTMIASANPDILTIVEWLSTETGLQQMIDKPLQIPGDKLVLSVHIYFNDVWGPYAPYLKAADFPNNLPAVWDKMFGDIGANRCVFVGEFGGKYGKSDPRDKQAQDAFADYLARRDIRNFAYWGWSDSSGGDTGGILADGGFKNVRDDKVSMLKKIWTAKARFTTDPIAMIPVNLPANPAGTILFPPVVEAPKPIPATPTPISEPEVSMPASINVTGIPEKIEVNLPDVIDFGLGDFKIPDSLKLTQDIAHSFGSFPQIALNVRQVPFAVEPEVTTGRKWAVGARVFLPLGTGINAIVTGYQGELTKCAYYNPISGEVSSMAVPEMILSAR